MNITDLVKQRVSARFFAAVTIVSLIFSAFPASFLNLQFAEASPNLETIVITGDTWDVANEPFTGTGWVFSSSPLPDLVPTEFTLDEASIGKGSFYGGPITGDASHKVIAALQTFTPVTEFGSFSYDFLIDSVDETDENEFYLNVYVNYGSSSPAKFYDCRYDVVPTVGSTGDFTTVTVNSGDTGYLAEDAGDYQDACPASIAEVETVSPGAIIRAFALNIGDTSANDDGVAGYYDRAVLETDSLITVYDFEPVPPEPNPLVSQCIDPSDNLLENGSFERPEVTKDRGWDLFSTTEWETTALDDGEEIKLEFHRGWSNNYAVDGDQFVELDPQESVKITQIPDVLEGATYELSWAFAPRHGVAAEENQLSVEVAGVEVATEGPATGDAGLEPLDWTRSNYTFVAASGTVEIAFSDAGVTSDSKGTFLDDARLCLVAEPDPEPPQVCSYDGEVVDYTQGTKNNGNPVDANRSDVSAVEIGVASYTNFFGKEGNGWSTDDFYSMGINGELVFEFTDKIAVDQPGPDIAIWEITGGNPDQQAAESADVYVSEDGVNFEMAGTVIGDGAVDISGTSVDFVKFVKLVDQSNGVQGGNGDGYDLDAITIIEGSCEDFVTVHTDKIVCDYADELPKYGNGGPNMTAESATNWLAENDDTSCQLVDGWEFEWAPKGTSDPGDTLVGSAGSDWNTFSGSTVIPYSEIDGDGFFWMREVLQDDYIAFTHGATPNNSDDYTAEMYCHTDVRNYDNFDRVDGPKVGGDYYCVAWNVPDPMCSLEAVSDTGTVVVENEAYAVETWVHPAWTAMIPGTTWIWEAFEVIDGTISTTKTFEETFTATGIKNAFLDVAADNSYKVYINDVLVADATDENNFKDFTQDEYDVTSYIVDGENTLEIEVTNASGNADPRKNPAGLLYKLTVDAETQCELTTYVDINEEPEYGPYCGDGIVQGEQSGGWEMCDGGTGCTDYCTFDNQCTDLQLVKITLDENALESTSFDGTLHLGAAGTKIPSGTWFNFDVVGDDAVSTIANGDIDGLAIERTDTELRLAVKGENSSTGFDYVFGNIMTKGIDLGTADRSTIPGWELENTGNYIDEFDIDQGTNSVDFKLWLTTGDDAVAVGVEEGEEYDCPQCKAGVEARIIVNDSGYAGAGSEIENIILGDAGYSTVEFGEWFPISEAPVEGASALMITDPNTVTNFDAPADKNGLFVSREDGTVKVALYGEFATGKTDNEWIDAYIEIRDAEITDFAKLPGDYKFENHPENDSVDSNDGFDEATASATQVDFKMWVDTGSDGFSFEINEETIAFCEDDSTDDMVIEGYKYEQGSDYIAFLEGWEIQVWEEGDQEVLVATTSTDVNGAYTFTLPQGDYDVYEVMQEGWTQVDVRENGESLYTDGDSQDHCEFDYNSQVDDQEFRCDFYNERDTDDLYYVEGYKYDVTGDSDPVPYAGWKIYASSSDQLLSTTTDSEGKYFFYLPEGEWEIFEGEVEGWQQVSVDQYDGFYPFLLTEELLLEETPITSCSFIFGEYFDQELVFSDQVAFAAFELQDVRTDTIYKDGPYCDFYNEQVETETEEEEEDNGGGSSSNGSSATRVNNSAPEGIVAGAATTNFCPFIEDYMQIGITNDTWEVTKLQMFLSMVMGYDVEVTGVFDEATDAAVKLFQTAYAGEILTPWFEQGIVPHNDPTGFVYKTTRWKINDIVCPDWESFPSFEGEDLNSNVDLD